MRRSGVNTVHPGVDLNAVDPYSDTLLWMRKWQAFIQEHPAEFRAVRTANDIGVAKTSGQIGIVLGMQNSEHFRAPADVFMFHGEGQRISQLTYNVGNRLGSGCVDRCDTGLSAFGADVIRAMNHIGMVVDVSHASEHTTLDAIDASRKPLLITHSNCRALVRHPRCKSDAVIRAMAAKGGVMGITGVLAFLATRGKATLDDVLDHFNHVARLVGVEHIGIGSDAGIDGAPVSPHLDVQGFNQPSRIFDLTEGLLRRNFSVSAISKILAAISSGLSPIFSTFNSNFHSLSSIS